MSITLIRKTWDGRYQPSDIYLNRIYQGKLYKDQQISLDVPDTPATLSLGWGILTKCQVVDGDQIIMKTNSWWLALELILLICLGLQFTNADYLPTPLILLLLLLLNCIIPRYRLVKSTEKESGVKV
ncbi:hypothetical protein [Streptococcus halotolerans]|uniref:hypothetical protein n=1 Tax=Streptococcus halotolerans TaxID=1814128 RepID=UPI000787A994|nr:hypothetical protein [Streptococcus halotolerans]